MPDISQTLMEDISPRTSPQDRDAPIVSVIISVSSEKLHLAGCLRSVEAHIPADLAYEVIVVLNGVSGEYEQLIRPSAHNARFVRSEIPLGFAGGLNRGRAEATGEFLIVLRDDSEVTDGWLEPLIRCARTHPNAGAVMSKILFPDGELQYAGSFLFSDGERLPPWGEGPAPSAADLQQVMEIDCCASSSLLVPVSAWDAVGGFDEALYLASYVDTDFSIALQQQGYQLMCEPASVVHRRRSSSTARYDKIFDERKNKRHFDAKWTSALSTYSDRRDGSASESLERAKERSRRHAETAKPRPAAMAVPAFDAQAQAQRIALGTIDSLTEFAAFVAKRQGSEKKSIPIYTLGTPLFFGTEGNGHPYSASDSLYEPETWGAWIRGRLTLFLPLAMRTRDAAPLLLKLDFRANHFLCAERLSSSFVVRVNGGRAYEHRETRTGIQSYTATIDPSLSDTLVVTIDVDDPLAPADAGMGEDLRPIGMALYDLTVRPASQD
ncbi:glycosyltransferase family 2 protein [Methylobacterium sp. J-068]|uniref:glycosyltransferase family 2 protein n=1 Tax=Methylobacterium sp. J-068 TaxID=2836649 RepID=UPI001FBA15B5|nr:glycosyltransferase [Methylobacterium sp. J-068]MCJ2035178.1 glycosyltransferase [Methylobacterium sp. J-068]